ncbi:acyl-CoA dehydrogenase family protein [Nocardia sp. NPDC051030]|uniref:acyl-CoA dehydrogenase family protein n=1 Tax=Nocardia sp. NPDC051030 TaxID=3155162 RepID=UPI00341C2BB5
MTDTSAISIDELERAAAELAELARAQAEDIEQQRCLPTELLDRFRKSGLFRMGAPATITGPQAPPAVLLACAETVAVGDAAAGWSVAIGSTCSLLAGWLPLEGAGEIFGDPYAVAAGVGAPTGTARRVPGGYRVSGRWAFASGIMHSDYMFGGCIVEADDTNAPSIRSMGMSCKEIRVLDTWHTSGLRGTGSHDVVAEDVFVPEHRSMSLLDQPVSTARLYRYPVVAFLAQAVAAVALGNARGAIDDLSGLAVGKSAVGSSKTLAQRSATWVEVAQAEAALRAARALFYDAIERAWVAAESPEPVSLELRAGLRLAATHAAKTGAEVAKSMYDLGGGTAIYDRSPLQRRFRDAHAITAHVQVNPASWELPGRLLLGQPTATAML